MLLIKISGFRRLKRFELNVCQIQDGCSMKLVTYWYIDRLYPLDEYHLTRVCITSSWVIPQSRHIAYGDFYMALIAISLISLFRQKFFICQIVRWAIYQRGQRLEIFNFRLFMFSVATTPLLWSSTQDCTTTV